MKCVPQIAIAAETARRSDYCPDGRADGVREGTAIANAVVHP